MNSPTDEIKEKLCKTIDIRELIYLASLNTAKERINILRSSDIENYAGLTVDGLLLAINILEAVVDVAKHSMYLTKAENKLKKYKEDLSTK